MRAKGEKGAPTIKTKFLEEPQEGGRNSPRRAHYLGER
jgi:hypothetical protein